MMPIQDASIPTAFSQTGKNGRWVPEHAEHGAVEQRQAALRIAATPPEMRWGFVIWTGINSIAIRVDIVVIVIATRSDLREEFSMADEAFALSPISARAAQPSEEDYDAISEAFMETSRGRWFLTEYAKRNRNADTRMVLDAVARIEESLAAQRRAAAVEADDKRIDSEALAAIRERGRRRRRRRRCEAFDGLALEQKLAPVRKGARVIREIAWRLREIGNDGRICDLIDSQVSGHRERRGANLLG